MNYDVGKDKDKKHNNVGNTVDRELKSLSFGNIIQAPLTAASDAQLDAAMNTIKFINTVGFKNGSKKDVRYVSFSYAKTSPTGQSLPTRMRVPVLALFNIPTLRVESVTIDFLAKIDSVETYKDQAQKIGAESAQKFITKGDAADPDDVQGNSSNLGSITGQNVDQRQTQYGYNVTRNFSYEIKVKAVNDLIPSGMERILNSLTSAIQTQAQIAGRQSYKNMGMNDDMSIPFALGA